MQQWRQNGFAGERVRRADMKGKFREEGAVEGGQLEETTAAMQGGRGDGEGLHMQQVKYNPHLHIKGENIAMEREEKW